MHNIADTEFFPIERRWADTHPETFQLIYGGAEKDRNVRIYARPTAPTLTGIGGDPASRDPPTHP